MSELTDDERQWWKIFRSMKGFPEHRKKELFHEFLQGRRDFERLREDARLAKIRREKAA